MVDVVTVFYLQDFHSIGPPNRQKINPSEYFLSWLSAKLASDAAVKTWLSKVAWPPKQIARFRVL